MQKALILISLLLPLFGLGQITSQTSSNVSYTPNLNGIGQNEIFIFCGEIGNTTGSLTATPTNQPQNVNFIWEKYNQVTFEYDTVVTDNNITSSTVNNLVESQYRVTINTINGNFIEQFTAWVFIDELAVSINNINDTLCNELTLNASINNNTLQYYNTSFEPLIIDSNTIITICLNATHTYVSDLGFYLIGPAECGSPRIELAPNPGAINIIDDVCNPGEDLTNFCFSTQSTDLFYVCDEEAPLTGTWKSYAGWDSLFGCNAMESGWTVQIFDCIDQDFGTLTQAQLTFTNSVNNTYQSVFYDSEIISAEIADNICSDTSAATHTYTFPEAQLITSTVKNAYSYNWSCANNNAIITNTDSSICSVQLTEAGGYWFVLNISDTLGNCSSVDSIFYQFDQPEKPIISYNKPYLFITNNNDYYTWLFNDSIIAEGQGMHQFIPEKDGDYRVIAQNSNDCQSDTSSVYTILITHLNQKIQDNSDFVIYPNPTNTKNYTVVKSSEAGQLEVYSLDGRLLLSKYLMKDEIYTLPLLNKGIYLVSLIGLESKYLQKLIVE